MPGWRKPEQIAFDLTGALEPKGIRFVLARADKIEPEQNRVITDVGDFPHDYLLIGTGPHFDWDAVPGLGPHAGHT